MKIDLSEQKAYFYKGGQLVGVSRISSGNESHRTPTGSFKVTQKNIDHRSNLYGEIVDAYGNVVNNDATNGKDPIPPGGKFVGASMPFFMRFNNAVGMHAGYLPGYPASHGCVRMPRWMAKNFYNHVEYGTPVTVVP
ncbi:MAG: L,D-transpeptidase family protein [Verrucomicrobiales bacterium]